MNPAGKALRAGTLPERGVLRFREVASDHLSRSISEQIRQHLLIGNLKTGDRLPSERSLAEQFAVSRNTVRQALRSLGDMGLLEFRKGSTGGAFVAEGGGKAVLMGFDDLYSLGIIQPGHLTEVRVMIGAEVVKLACERCTEDDLLQLEDNIARAEAEDRNAEIEHRVRINLEFYQLLARMTGNPVLMTLTDMVGQLTKRFVEQIGPTSSESVMPVRRRMLAYLRQRDAKRAEQAMRDHLLQLQQIYLEAIDAQFEPRSAK